VSGSVTPGTRGGSQVLVKDSNESANEVASGVAKKKKIKMVTALSYAPLGLNRLFSALRGNLFKTAQESLVQ